MDRTRWAILILVVVAIGGFAFLLLNDNTYQWGVYLRTEGDQPYDLGVFADLMDGSVDGQEVRILDKKDDLVVELDEENEPVTVFFMGRSVDPTRSEMETLLNHVENGGTVVYLSPSPPENLLARLFFPIDTLNKMEKWMVSNSDSAHVFPDSVKKSFVWSDQQQMDSVIQNFQWNLERNLRQRMEVIKLDSGTSKNFRIGSAGLPIAYQVRDTVYKRYWEEFDEKVFEDLEVHPTLLGYSDDSPNFISLKKGKGQIILHLGAIAFTNILVKEDEFADYSDAFFKVFPREKVWVDLRNRRVQPLFGGLNNFKYFQSPLTFILSQPALKWAWYILVFGAGLYVFFQSKRIQRVIPPIPPLTNNTLSFAKALGKLRFRQPDHNRMAKELFTDLHLYFRKRFRITGFSGKKEEWDQVVRFLPSSKKIILRLAFLDDKRKRVSLEAWELKELYNLRIILLNQIAHERRK